MSVTTKRPELSRRTFLLSGAAGALAAGWTLSLAHAQLAAGNINFRVTGGQSPSVVSEEVSKFAAAAAKGPGQ